MRTITGTCSLLFLFLSLFLLQANAAASHKYLVYIGTFTDTGSKGIYVYRFDAATGDLSPLGVAAETASPSFLVPDRAGRFLYAVNELQKFQDQESGAVSAFAIDKESGKLKFLNQVSSHGANPAHITLDNTGKYVLIANYFGGNVATFPVRPDGSIGEASTIVQHHGHGAISPRQDTPHAHAIVPSPDNRFVLVADLGLDEVLVYRFDPAKGSLTLVDADTTKLDPGAGPRHIAFSRDGKFVYVINEIQSSVAVFSYNKATGALHFIQKLSTLPKDYSGPNDDAEIQLHPSGKFLYASNRGHDSIAVFSVDKRKGTLTFQETVSSGGKIPRGFSLDPTGKWLFAANQKTDTVLLLKVDPKTGRLTPTNTVVSVPSPVCVVFVPIP